MAKTVLNLKLQYNGKLLDIAKYGRDFTKKLYIGSSKFLFWQILDKKFPKKHLFLTSKNNKFYLNLLPDMEVSFLENNQLVDKETLQKRKLISGSEILLSNELTGSVKLNPDWIVTYEFVEPWVTKLTEEERQIVSRYSRRSELQPFQKFTRNFLLAATFFTIAGLILFDTFKPDYSNDLTLAERWQQMQAIATKVEIPRNSFDQFSEESIQPQPKTEEIEQTTTARPQTGKVSAGTMSKAAARAALSGILGQGGFQPGSTGTGIVAVTTEENIIAASLGGGRGGGSGTGRGTGANGPGGQGTGGGSGFGTVFNPSEIPSGTTNLAGLSSGRPQGKLSNTAPAGDVTTYVGNASRIVAVGKPSNKVSSGVITRFSGPAVTKVAEGGISAAPVDSRPELQRIEQRVARYKPQIKDLFNRYSQIKSMYGTIKYTIYIDSDGSVAGVQLTPMSGEFYPEFLKQLEQLIKGWRFDNKNLVPYEFIMTFVK